MGNILTEIQTCSEKAWTCPTWVQAVVWMTDFGDGLKKVLHPAVQIGAIEDTKLVCNKKKKENSYPAH